MRQLTRRSSADLVPVTPADRLGGLVAAWLHQKFQRSKSHKTERAYTDGVKDFRATLQASGYDLDSDATVVGFAAQAWSARPHPRRGDPAPTTIRQRLAILSSFYTYAVSKKQLPTNPITTVERPPVHAYAGVKALDADAVRAGLAAIDRSALLGLRDYALLALGLQTGRRVQELASLTGRDLTWAGELATVRFVRTKGGGQASDELSPAVSAALRAYLIAQHGTPAPGAETPLWISARGRPLDVKSIAAMCERRLGTSRVHSLRHTFARAMEDAGAKLSEIQARLGHKNAATTGIYLAALRAAENPHAPAVAARFGIGDADAPDP
jgi:integrase/recombinase XerC